MNRLAIRAVLSSLLWGVIAPASVFADDDKAAGNVGEILVIGNEVTRQDVILQAVGLVPGKAFTQADLRTAERNRKRLGIFRVDAVTGVQPTVTVLEGQGEFRPVLVSVQETATTTLRLEPGLGSRADLVVRLVQEERNFDPSRFPIGLDDLLSGRAFRGGGQRLRFVPIQFHILEGRVALCPILDGELVCPRRPVDPGRD